MMEFRTLKDGRVIPIANPKTSFSQSNLAAPQKPPGFKGYRSKESFTIPNYVCRTCGQRVFYYEHPNGAKVLFDSLGPPWPKHPCYQFVGAPKASRAISNTKQKIKCWIPAFLERVIALKSGVMRVQIKLNEHQLRFELSPLQVKALSVNQWSIKEALFQVDPLSLTAHNQVVSIHTGKQPLQTLAHKVVTKQTEEEIEASVKAQESDDGQTPEPTKTLKSSQKPILNVINPRLMLTGITLTIKSDSYFLITGTCLNKPMVLGASLEVQENQKVLKILTKNPQVLELLPVKKVAGFFYIVHRNSKLGRLEQNPDLVKIAFNKQPATANENPFRNPVLSASALQDLKTQITKNPIPKNDLEST